MKVKSRLLSTSITSDTKHEPIIHLNKKVTKLNDYIIKNDVSGLIKYYIYIYNKDITIPTASLCIHENELILHMLIDKLESGLILFLLEHRIKDVNSNLYLFSFLAYLIEISVNVNTIISVFKIVAKDIDLECNFHYKGKSINLRQYILKNYPSNRLLPLLLHNNDIMELDLINVFKSIRARSTHVISVRFISNLPLMYIHKLALYCREKHDTECKSFTKILLYLLNRYVIYDWYKVINIYNSSRYKHMMCDNTKKILYTTHARNHCYTPHQSTIDIKHDSVYVYNNEIRFNHNRFTKCKGTFTITRDTIALILKYLKYSRSDIFNYIQYINHNFHYSTILDRTVIDYQFYMNCSGYNALPSVVHYLNSMYGILRTVNKIILPRLYPWPLDDVISTLSNCCPNLTCLEVNIPEINITDSHDDCKCHSAQLFFNILTALQELPTLTKLYISFPSCTIANDCEHIFIETMSKYIARTSIYTSNVTHLTIDIHNTRYMCPNAALTSIFTLIYTVFNKLTTVCYRINEHYRPISLPHVTNVITSLYIECTHIATKLPLSLVHTTVIEDIFICHPNLTTLYIYFTSECDNSICIVDLLRIITSYLYRIYPHHLCKLKLNQIIFLCNSFNETDSDYYNDVRIELESKGISIKCVYA